MAWLLARLPAAITGYVAFPKRASFDDFPLPPPKKAKFAASSSKAPVEDLPVQSGKNIIGHVNEVFSPSPEQPLIELVFFHGLQLKGSQKAQHLDTWHSEDGNELWLKWILDNDKFPNARILTISYDAHAEKTENDGHMDMYVTTENLVQDLIQAKVGQNKCPVVLVGHCIGGLVMKQLCVSATTKGAITRNKLTQKFLNNLKGLFFFATPHFGTKLAENTDFTKGCLFEDLKPLNTDAARQREEFIALRKTKGWKTFGMGETCEVTLGNYEGLVVPEASARCDMDEFYSLEANHFNISRPSDRKSSSFQKLVNFIKGVLKETEGPIQDDRIHEVTGLPQCSVGLETRAQAIQEKLKGGAVLGIFGMGGIGKSTLAVEVFNRISKDFEYTCFIKNVKGFTINELEKSVLERFYYKGSKLDGAKTQWSQMKGKQTLIVMDDTDAEDQLGVLPPWQDFGHGSCLIITSRNKGVFKFYRNHIVHDVKFLDTNEAAKLFCKHAFDSEDIPEGNLANLRNNVRAVVEKCGGLPLSLEVMGRYLRDAKSNAMWEETLHSLEKAIPIDGSRNDKLWATLELSYKNLSESAQEMFCDAATFFFEEELDTFLAVWSDRKAETTWKNLVDRAMVKVSDKTVWVHEQLRDLAKRLTKDTVLSSTDEEEVNAIVEQLNAKQVNARTVSLRLKCIRTTTMRSTLRVDSLVGLEQLKYIAINGVLHEGDEKSLTKKLRYLRWDFTGPVLRPSLKISLINMTDLAVLELYGCVISKDFSNLVNLRILKLKKCDVAEGFLKALGNLKNLRNLCLRYLNTRMHIPQSLGNHSHSQLTRLKLVDVNSLTVLPESFSQHSTLKDLTIRSDTLGTLPESFGALKSVQNVNLICPKLERLPDHFGQLATLDYLSIRSEELETLPQSFGSLSAVRTVNLTCPKLERLPDTFGGLSCLEDLTLDCSGLKGLWDNFGQLATLMELRIRSEELETLPQSFGSLSAVRTVYLTCPKLERLPDTFGGLSCLEGLGLYCSGLKGLSDNFGQLATLKYLIIRSEELETLPQSFGSLSAVRTVYLTCPKLERLPDTFGGLSCLEGLGLYCSGLKGLSDNFGQLATLKYLIIRSKELETLPQSFGSLSAVRTVDLTCPKLERLPGTFGGLSCLEDLTLDCSGLKGLSDNFGQLATLKYLIIRSKELETLPQSFGSLSAVRTVDLTCPKLERLPDTFGGLSCLERLTLDCSGLKVLSDNFGQLATLEYLHIASKELDTLPQSFGSLSTVLEMSWNCPKLGRGWLSPSYSSWGERILSGDSDSSWEEGILSGDSDSSWEEGILSGDSDSSSEE